MYKSPQQSALYLAAKNGDVSKVKLLLAAEPAVNINDNENLNLLRHAAAAGSLAVIKFLVEEENFLENCNILHSLSPIFQAAENGHLDVVKYFVEHLQVDVCLRNGNGQFEGLTTLHAAARYGHLDVVSYLADQPYADIKAKSVDGGTPLLMAASSGSFETFKLLLDRGADISDEDYGKNNLLHYAAVGENLKIIEFLVEQQQFDVNNTNKKDLSAVLVAAKHGQLDALKYFMKSKEFDINDLNSRYGYNVMHLAVKNGHLNIIEFLLEYQNVNVEIKNKVLADAASSGHVDIVKLFLASGAVITEECFYLHDVLSSAVNNGNAAMIELLLEKAAHLGCKEVLKTLISLYSDQLDLLKFLSLNNGDISDTELNEFNLLHYATKHENLEAIELLVTTKNFDVNCRNGAGETPLHIAAQFGKTCALKYLAATKNLCVDIKNNKGLTPLQLAIEHKQLNVVIYLIETLGADAKTKADDGMTALLLAFAKDNLVAIKTLLKCGANIKDTTKSFKNVLHFAASNGSLETIKFILEFAERMRNTYFINSQTKLLKATLHYASRSGSVDTVKFIIELGSYTYLMDHRLESALHYAVRSGNPKLIKFLIGQGSFLAHHTNRSGESAFLLAVQYGLLDIVKYFYGIDQQSKDRDNNAKALKLAFDNGHLHVIKYLVKEQAVNINNERDGKTILDLALEKRDITTVRFLLKCGANINYRRSLTLLNAAKDGDTNIKKLLTDDLDFNANMFTEEDGNGHLKFVEHLFKQKYMSVKSINEDKATVLHEAAIHGDLGVVDYLVKHQKADLQAKRSDGSTALLGAAKEIRTETVKQLLQMGADYDDRDYDNNSFFYYANFDAGDLDFMQDLIEQRKYDINDVNGIGKLMFFASDKTLRADIMKYLLKKMNADKIDDFIMTLLHEAAYRGDLERVEYLVKVQNANVNAKCSIGKTALLWAVTSESLDTVKFLLECDANIHDKDIDDNGIIHYAAVGKSLNILKYLIEDRNVDAVCKNKYDLTPLFLAAQRGVLWSIEYFVEKRGISIYMKNNQGQTALFQAIRGGNLSIVRYFIEKHDYNLYKRDNNGLSPLNYAVEQEEGEIVRYIKWGPVFGLDNQ